MTAFIDLIRSADRQLLEDRRRELAELDRLMRRPGGLAATPEPPPIHTMARDTAAERTTAS